MEVHYEGCVIESFFVGGEILFTHEIYFCLHKRETNDLKQNEILSHVCLLNSKSSSLLIDWETSLTRENRKPICVTMEEHLSPKCD